MAAVVGAFASLAMTDKLDYMPQEWPIDDVFEIQKLRRSSNQMEIIHRERCEGG
jgi:hypothetical protein